MHACQQGFNPTYHEQAPTREQLESQPGYAVVEFGAPWCGHCQAATLVAQAPLTQLKLPHIRVYDGKGKALGRSFAVTLWPTFILLRDGVEIGRLVRPTQQQEIDRLLAAVEQPHT